MYRLAIVFSALISNLAYAQQPALDSDEVWRELPRNTTVYVPAPRPALPVAAFSACSNRYEGESCRFATHDLGSVDGTCSAPELREPTAYGIHQQQRPVEVQTGLVCVEADAQPPEQPPEGVQSQQNPVDQ